MSDALNTSLFSSGPPDGPTLSVRPEPRRPQQELVLLCNSGRVVVVGATVRATSRVSRTAGEEIAVSPLPKVRTYISVEKARFAVRACFAPSLPANTYVMITTRQTSLQSLRQLLLVAGVGPTNR